MGLRPRAKAARRGPAGDASPDGHRPFRPSRVMRPAGGLFAPRAHPGPDGSGVLPSPRRPRPPCSMWGGSAAATDEDHAAAAAPLFRDRSHPPRPPVPGGCGGWLRAWGTRGGRPPRAAPVAASAAGPPRPRGVPGRSGPVLRRRHPPARAAARPSLAGRAAAFIGPPPCGQSV